MQRFFPILRDNLQNEVNKNKLIPSTEILSSSCNLLLFAPSFVIFQKSSDIRSRTAASLKVQVPFRNSSKLIEKFLDAICKVQGSVCLAINNLQKLLRETAAHYAFNY